MYYALEIADHRLGISWSEVTKLFNTSSVKSQWLESINRVKKYIFDELEGNTYTYTYTYTYAYINRIRNSRHRKAD